MSVTSYAALFRSRDDRGLGLNCIRIPMIQRDYAQGRMDPKSSQIRDIFIQTLTDAVLPESTGDVTPVGLDFVYGEVREGVLFPLDGQQRLTALFLLHWYLAVRSGGSEASWLSFTYDTRASARQFCEELRKAASSSGAIECKPDFSNLKPAEWIIDQSWFMPGWKSEPTIISMLVVLDDVHRRLASTDPTNALARLTNRDQPAIFFQFLDLADFGLDDNVYVRMNSRGKPLTEFEIFKARLGAKLEAFDPSQAQEFARLVDGSWLDTFWVALAKGRDEPPTAAEVDASILRYMRYLADFLYARENGFIKEVDTEADICLLVFGDEANQTRLDWLFRAFVLWNSGDLSVWFARHFDHTHDGEAVSEERLPLFDLGNYDANLFLACCKEYNPERYNVKFPMRLALLLYAIQISERATDLTTMRRLRIVRNLADWSANEIRPENIGRLIAKIEQIMAGNLPDGAGFNVAQMEDERRKAKFLEQNPLLEPYLHRLEDHDLLRGRLTAFSLAPQTLRIYVAAFERSFGSDMSHDGLAAAFLAADDYTDRGYKKRQLFPARQNGRRWRELLTGTKQRQNESPVTAALQAVLTCVSESDLVPNESLNRFLTQPFIYARILASWFDWRYYFCFYPSMRVSDQGFYLPDGSVRMGYVVRQYLNKGWASGDTDPYLGAVCASVAKDLANRLILERAERVHSGQRLRLLPSGITLESRQTGWRVYLSDEGPATLNVQAVFAAFGLQRCAIEIEPEGASVCSFWDLPIVQVDAVHDNMTEKVDQEDRVSRAAEFIAAILRATDVAAVINTVEGDPPSQLTEN